MNLLQLIPAHFFTFDRKKRRRSVAGVDQEELHDPETIADPDSLFYNFSGTPVHHKICHGKDDQYDQAHHQNGGGTEATGLSMILLHGFAAWVFSWGEVMKPLARLTGSDILAFDRPGFGLTPRVNHCSSSIGANSLPTKSDSNPYSMAFSAAATLSFLDLLGARKGILMGHSAGCFVAVDAYFKTPDRVSALILVAPAIVAPFGRRRPRSSSDDEENDRMRTVKRRRSSYNEHQPITISGGLFEQGTFCWNRLTSVLCAFVLTILVHLMRGVKVTITSMYRRMLSVFLRSTFAVFLTRVLIDKYGLSTLRKAWFDDTKVTDYVIQNYARVGEWGPCFSFSPLKVKGWEKALLEHILSLFTHPSESLKPFNRRLLSEISCPVLIVTGDSDQIVPAWNSIRLSSAIAGSTLEVINDCGHLPHEEKPKEFLVVVEKFLRTLPTVGEKNGGSLIKEQGHDNRNPHSPVLAE